MLRRASYISSSSLQTRKTTTAIFSCFLSSISSHRRNNSSSNNNDGSSSSSSLSDLIAPELQRVSKFLQKPPGEREHEIVILVDATALFYRTAFNWAAMMAGKGALEADPSSFLQSRIPRVLQFCHSIIPVGDGSEFQPQLLPPDVAMDAAAMDYLQPTGGPWQTVEQYKTSRALTKQKEDKMKLMIEEKYRKLKNEQKREKNSKKKFYVEEEQKQEEEEIDIEKMNSKPLDTASIDVPLLFAESQTSPGFFKRRVIFCFDHGSKRYTRSKFVEEYKGQRFSCGRIASFLGYASALTRQLESIGLIQGIFPSNLPPVLHDHKSHINTDEKYRDIINRFSDLSSSSSSKKSASASSPPIELSKKAKELFPNDIVKQSIFDGATISSPKESPTFAEGDDILQSCVKHFSEVEKVPTVVITHDKDLLQLLEFPKTYFFHLRQNTFISRSQTCEDYGITSPKNLEDYLVFCGDTADNIRGLPETGDARAMALVKTFQTVEKLVEVARDRKKNGKSAPAKKQSGEDFVQNDEYLSKITIPARLSKTMTERRLPTYYLVKLYDTVCEHADRLLKNKEHVIRLQQVPEVDKFLADGMKSFSDPVVYPEIPRHFFSSGVYRRNLKNIVDKHLKLGSEYLERQKKQHEKDNSNDTRDNETNQEQQQDKQTSSTTTSASTSSPSTTSSSSSSAPLVNEGVFRAIREYYVKTVGPCNASNERDHHCGDTFGINSKKSQQIREWETSKTQQKKQRLVDAFEENKKKARALLDSQKKSNKPSKSSSSKKKVVNKNKLPVKAKGKKSGKKQMPKKSANKKRK